MADDLNGSPPVEDEETSNGNQSDPEQELLDPSEAATTWEPCNFPFMDEDDSSEDEFLNLSERLFASDSETDTEYENEPNSLCEDCLNRANNDEDAMDTGSSSNDNDGAQNMTPEFPIESNANVDTLIANLNDRTRLNIVQARAVTNRTVSVLNHLYDVLYNRVAARDRLLAARNPAQPPVEVFIVKRKYI